MGVMNRQARRVEGRLSADFFFLIVLIPYTVAMTDKTFEVRSVDGLPNIISLSGTSLHFTGLGLAAQLPRVSNTQAKR